MTHCPDDRRLGAQEPRRFWKCETRLPLATAEDAGITRFHRGTLETIGATSELVSSTDKLQYTLLSGPCIDAVLGEGMFHTGQLRSESRWPQFGPQAFEATGVQSMLSYRLFVEEQGDAVTCLNFYSTKPHAFDLWSQTFGLLLATHGALALANARARERNENFKVALASNRQIDGDRHPDGPPVHPAGRAGPAADLEPTQQPQDGRDRRQRRRHRRTEGSLRSWRVPLCRSGLSI